MDKIIFAAGACALALTIPAHAQQRPGAGVTTPLRRASSLERSTSSVTVIGRSAAIDLASLLKNRTGVSVSLNGGIGGSMSGTRGHDFTVPTWSGHEPDDDGFARGSLHYSLSGDYDRGLVYSSGLASRARRQYDNRPRGRGRFPGDGEIVAEGRRLLCRTRFSNHANTIRMPAYTTIDLAAIYRLDEQSRFKLSVENLLDKRYERIPNYIATGRTVSLSFSRIF